jgi:hypothetical protein
MTFKNIDILTYNYFKLEKLLIRDDLTPEVRTALDTIRADIELVISSYRTEDENLFDKK